MALKLTELFLSSPYQVWSRLSRKLFTISAIYVVVPSTMNLTHEAFARCVLNTTNAKGENVKYILTTKVSFNPHEIPELLNNYLNL